MRTIGYAIALVVQWLAFPAWCADVQEAPAFSQGRRFDERRGDAIYRAICQGCHMPDGRGATGAGSYPAFVDNPRVASATYVAAIVLQGRRNMPAFGVALDDAQVAAVATEVRTRFAPRGVETSDATIDAAGVAALRPAR